MPGLSVAGMRAGLNGAHSGLFMEQIRIIQEMRDANKKSGRTGIHIRPRFGVWENVVGALSSGRDAETGQKKPGADFQKVLEAFLQVEEPYYDISKALHIFFVLSNQAGDIWVEDGLRYYMHSKEAGRHNLPHIHVDYKHECSATISLYDGKMVDGDMPRRVMKRASKKIMDNQRYLMECWNKLTDGLRIDLNVYFGVTPLKL